MNRDSKSRAIEAISVFDEYETHVIVLTRRGKNPPQLLAEIQVYLRTPTDLPLLDPASQVAKSIRMYFVCIRRPDRDVYFLSSLSSKARLAQSGRLAAALWNGVFDTLKRQVLVFDANFDGVIVSDYIFTTKPATVERLLGVLADIQRVAARTFDAVTERLAIKNLDQFELRRCPTST